MSSKKKLIIVIAIIVICITLFFLPKKVHIDSQNIDRVVIDVSVFDLDGSEDTEHIAKIIDKDVMDKEKDTINMINDITYHNDIRYIYENIFGYDNTYPYSSGIMNISIFHIDDKIDNITLFSDHQIMSYNDKLYTCDSDYYQEIYTEIAGE